MTSEGFLTDINTMMVFFRYVRRYNVPTEEKARVEVLRRLVAKKKVKYLRDPKSFIAGKNVGWIK